MIAKSPAVLEDAELEHAAGGQTREHVLLARQAGVPSSSLRTEDEDRPVVILNPDGP